MQRPYEILVRCSSNQSGRNTHGDKSAKPRPLARRPQKVGRRFWVAAGLQPGDHRPLNDFNTKMFETNQTPM